jgi:hypothetical protein
MCRLKDQVSDVVTGCFLQVKDSSWLVRNRSADPQAFQQATKLQNAGRMELDKYCTDAQAASPDGISKEFRCTYEQLGTFWQIQRHIRLQGAAVTRLNVYLNPEDDFKAFFRSSSAGAPRVYNLTSNTTAANRWGFGHAIVLVGYDNKKNTWLALNSWGPDWPYAGANGLFEIAYGAAGVGNPSETFGLTCTPVEGSVHDRYGLREYRRVLDVVPDCGDCGNCAGAADYSCGEYFYGRRRHMDDELSMSYRYKCGSGDTLSGVAEALGVKVVDIVECNKESTIFPVIQVNVTGVGGCGLGGETIFPVCLDNVAELYNVSVPLDGRTLKLCNQSMAEIYSVAHVRGDKVAAGHNLAAIWFSTDTSSAFCNPQPGGSPSLPGVLFRYPAFGPWILFTSIPPCYDGSLLGLRALYDYISSSSTNLQGADYSLVPDRQDSNVITTFPLSWLDLFADVTLGRVVSIEVIASCFVGQLSDGLARLTSLRSFALWGRGDASLPCKGNSLGKLPRSWASSMQHLEQLIIKDAGRLERSEPAPSEVWWPSTWSFPRLAKLMLSGVGLSGVLPEQLPLQAPKLACLDLAHNDLSWLVWPSYGNEAWSAVRPPSTGPCIVTQNLTVDNGTWFTETHPFEGFKGNSKLVGCAPYLPAAYVVGTGISVVKSECAAAAWLQDQNNAMLALRRMLVPASSASLGWCLNNHAADLAWIMPDTIEDVDNEHNINALYCYRPSAWWECNAWECKCQCTMTDESWIKCSWQAGAKVAPQVTGLILQPEMGRYSWWRWSNCDYQNIPPFDIGAFMINILPLLPALRSLEISKFSDVGPSWPFYGELPNNIGAVLPHLEVFRCGYGWGAGCGLTGQLPEDLGNVTSFSLHGTPTLKSTLPSGWVMGMVERKNTQIGPNLRPKIHIISPNIVGPLPRTWGVPGYKYLRYFDIDLVVNLSGCFPDRLITAWRGWTLPLPKCSSEDGQLAALFQIKDAFTKLPLTKRGATLLGTWAKTHADESATVDGDPAFCVRWRGVKCDLEGWVTSLELPFVVHTNDTRITFASLLPALLQLPELQKLDLRGNGLQGTLPEALAGMASLQQLDLTSNDLIGSLPSAWLMFNQLQVLNLSNNRRLSGGIPGSWAAMQALQELRLARCNLTGSLPATFAYLQSLETLDVSNQIGAVRLTGTLPAAWADPTTVQPQSVALLIKADIAAAQAAAVAAMGQAGFDAAVPRGRALEKMGLEAYDGTGSVEGAAAAVAQHRQSGLYAAAAQAAAGVSAVAEAVAAGRAWPLSGLARLYIKGNALSGSLPAQWSALTSLEVRTAGVLMRVLAASLLGLAY